MPLRNDEYWQEIEELPAFKEDAPNSDKLWEALEKFQKDTGGKLNAISLMSLRQLIEATYMSGRMAPVQETVVEIVDHLAPQG